jgi:protein-L-isoaspartate(D-aspartate) O-methyltransferase
MDIEQARFNMVEQQIRTWEVLDQGVLDLLFLVRREDFVPPEYRLSLSPTSRFRSAITRRCGRRRWSARAQELQVAAGRERARDRHGSGYLTALSRVSQPK